MSQKIDELIIDSTLIHVGYVCMVGVHNSWVFGFGAKLQREGKLQRTIKCKLNLLYFYINKTLISWRVNNSQNN